MEKEKNEKRKKKKKILEKKSKTVNGLLSIKDNMIPNKLKRGNTIGIIAPSGFTKEDDKQFITNAKKKLESLGLDVVFSKNLFNVDKYGVSAGTPEERAEDLNEMFANKNINAIYCAQGGGTAIQLLSLINFKTIKQNPKIFLGMSDIDVLHLAINTKTDLIVFNGADPKSGRNRDLDFDYTWKNFQQRFFNASKQITPSSSRKCIRAGTAEGKLLGCNITSIIKLAGTQYFPDFKKSILFLEGYSTDVKSGTWKLELLKELGVFDKINGIVIGYILGFQDKEWRTKNNITIEFEELVHDLTREYDFPILKTNDFGHRSPNCFLPIGAKIKMDALSKQLEIIEDFLK